LADGAGAGFFTAIVPAPANLDAPGKVFYHFTNSRVFRTNDGGLNFTLIGSATAPTSPGLPAARRFRSSPYNLGVSPIDLNHIALGSAGGFIDITTNGGATWTDIGVGSYNGTTNAVTSSPLGTNHPAFVNRMVGWPNFATVTRNLGTAFANQTVQIRFRIGADESTGAPGWDIDNVTITGITTTPFTALVAETGSCTP
jgi:hypothetical protein